MSKLLVRHGLSKANDRNNVGALAFGRPDAGLMELGRTNARDLNGIFRTNFGFIPEETPVATSDLLRTKETAREAGFLNLAHYACLNEVIHGMELPELRHMLRIERKVPTAASRQAERILTNPPTESIWFTHGLVIIGLCNVLGIEREHTTRFVPEFCEIVELPID